MFTTLYTVMSPRDAFALADKVAQEAAANLGQGGIQFAAACGSLKGCYHCLYEDMIRAQKYIRDADAKLDALRAELARLKGILKEEGIVCPDTP